MSGIRVTYSGLITFVFGVIGIITGMILTIILTRSLDPIEYGTWGLIMTIIGYVIIIEPVISYWTTRDVARKNLVGKTAIFSSTMFSCGGIIIYILIAYAFGYSTDANHSALVFASILVPVIFLNRTLMAINFGWKPHVVSYGLLAYGIFQIPFSLLFVFHLDMGVSGIIISTLIANVASMITYAIYARGIIRTKIKIAYLKRWIKLFWLPTLYPGIYSIMTILDVAVFSLVIGSMTGLAFWIVCLTLPKLIAQAATISRAVYPKLIGEENKNYLSSNITLFFYFLIPLTSLSIIFARPILFALNPIYEQAYLVAIFASLFTFFVAMSHIFQLFLTGKENVDMNTEASFKDYIKSKLFTVPSLLISQYAIYLVALTVILLIFKDEYSELQLVTYWSITAMITSIPFSLYLFSLVKKNFALKLETKLIMKYIGISVVIFGLTWIISERFLVYSEDVFQFIPQLLLLITIGVVGYLAATYLLDLRIRQLSSAIIMELSNESISLKIFKKLAERPMNKGQAGNKIISKTGRYVYKKIKPEFIEKFGYKLYLDPDDHLLLAINEYPIHSVLKKIIHHGDTVIDVGANIGVLTLFFRNLVGNEGMIYSFEPNPTAFSVLKKNINENNLTNVQIENTAVSNTNGKISFEMHSSITNSRIAKNHEDGITVDCVSIDEYFIGNKMKKINFAKIDTEGYDLTVLEGMTKIIQLNPDLKIMIEYHTRLLQEAGIRPKDLLKFLRQQNFKIYDMGGLFDRLELLEDENLEMFAKTPNATNLLCMHNETDIKNYQH